VIEGDPDAGDAICRSTSRANDGAHFGDGEVVTISTRNSASSPACAADSWSAWGQLWRSECPSHHVDWMCGDCYLSVVEAFDATLSEVDQTRVLKIADTQRFCAGEAMGFGCETTRSLTAYQELGLMRRFAHFSCKVVKCEEAAICSRMPPGP